MSKQTGHKDNLQGGGGAFRFLADLSAAASEATRRSEQKSTVSKSSARTLCCVFGLPRLGRAVSLQPADGPMRGILKSHATLNTHKERERDKKTHF